VWVFPDGEIQKNLKVSAIVADFQASNRTHTAYVIDAEQNIASAWGKIKEFAKDRFPNVPKNIPKEGLILSNNDGIKFGAWIMPDNGSPGMLEDFLATLVPDKQSPLWTHAVNSVAKARKNFGAPCTDVHLPKAHLHTWLAFQEPPGRRMGPAISEQMLDAARAKAFIEWFRKMFDV
jgi:hypothetical protein